MSLNRLNRRNAAMLVQGLVGAGPRLPNDVADAIVERCDGVPLFLEELTKAILEEAVEATEVAVSVPATLRASLLARLDRLGPDAKEVAQIGAAIGREFSFELLAAVAGQDLMRPEVAVNKLVEADLVFSTESFHRPAFCSSIRWCRRPPTTHYYARCVSFCTRGWPMRSFLPTVKK